MVTELLCILTEVVDYSPPSPPPSVPTLSHHAHHHHFPHHSLHLPLHCHVATCGALYRLFSSLPTCITSSSPASFTLTISFSVWATEIKQKLPYHNHLMNNPNHSFTEQILTESTVVACTALSAESTVIPPFAGLFSKSLFFSIFFTLTHHLLY